MKGGLWNGSKPVIFMVAVQIAYAGLSVILKLAINDGMKVIVITAYRLAFGSALIIPLALVSERKKRSKLTWRVLFMSFLCGFFGASLFQILFAEALVLTTATVVSAMYNLIPAVTFVIAVCCGLEKLDLRAATGKAKVLGSLIGIGGAMLLAFYKGVEIKIWPFHINLLHTHYSHVATPHGESGSHQWLGVLYAVGSCFSFALWFIIQAKMNKEYPNQYSGTALMYIWGAIQATVFGLCVERDWSQWKLGWNIRLLTVVYSAIVTYAIVVTSWCIKIRGPLFASIFNPLLLVFVALAASLMLDEKLYIGSLIGAVLIVSGLFMVLWGTNREMKKITPFVPSEMTQEIEVIQVDGEDNIIEIEGDNK